MTNLAEIARCCVVTFPPNAAATDKVIGDFKEPVHCQAVATPLESQQFLAVTSPQGDELYLMVISEGVSSAVAEKEIDAFFNGLGKSEAVFRGSVRSARVSWSRNRAFIACAPDIEAEIIDAALRFTLAARATFDLERDMMSAWPMLGKHSNLSHAVSAVEQAEQPAVNQMTEKFARMKVVHLRVQNAIEQLDPMLGSHSKRLFSQLVSPSALYDRMEMLEDPIQFGQDHYELANTRLIEGKYSTTELRLEWLIVIILLAELLAILADKIHFN